MKILIAIDFPSNPDSPAGGVEAVGVNLVSGIAKYTDREVSVVTFSTDVDEVSSEKWGRVTVNRIPMPTGNLLTNAISKCRILISQEIDKIGPDVIHAHDTYGLMVQEIRTPRIFTVHGFSHADILVSGRKFRRLISAVWKYFETSGWASHDAVISISPYVREMIRQYFSGPIFNIENPIGERFFDIARNMTSATVFCSAAICNRKNTFGLIKAVEIVNQSGTYARLVLAGPAVEPDYYRMLVEYVRRNGLNDYIVFLGQVDSDQVCQELARANVFALVSREENAPMGIEEAMAVGLPILTSNRCGMPYMVDHGYGGLLVDETNPREIAAALQALFSCSTETLGRISQRNKNIAQERFHPKSVVERTVAAYEQVVSGKSCISG